jgi:hypothetical protein
MTFSSTAGPLTSYFICKRIYLVFLIQSASIHVSRTRLMMMMMLMVMVVVAFCTVTEAGTFSF